MTEEFLEELYELLELYFETYKIKEGLINASKLDFSISPQLDLLIMREEVLSKIKILSQKLQS